MTLKPAEVARVEDIPHFYWLKEIQNKHFFTIIEWFNMQVFIYEKNCKNKFYVVTYRWPTLFSSIPF